MLRGWLAGARNLYVMIAALSRLVLLRFASCPKFGVQSLRLHGVKVLALHGVVSTHRMRMDPGASMLARVTVLHHVTIARVAVVNNPLS
jgi:hypothetical protein